MEQKGDLKRAEPTPGWGCGQYAGRGIHTTLWLKTTKLQIFEERRSYLKEQRALITTGKQIERILPSMGA